MLQLIKALKFVNDASKANEFKPQCGKENLSPELVRSRDCSLRVVGCRPTVRLPMATFTRDPRRLGRRICTNWIKPSRRELRRLVGHNDLALRRGQPVQKRFARSVVMPKKSPGRPVPVDRHPALAPIRAGGRPLHDRIDEKEHIADPEMDFDGRCNAVR